MKQLTIRGVGEEYDASQEQLVSQGAIDEELWHRAR